MPNSLIDSQDLDTQRYAKPVQLAPLDAYKHSLQHLDDELTDFDKAIDEGSCDLVGIRADHAISLWIATNAAYRRMSTGPSDTLTLEAAHRDLTERHKALTVLFERAAATFTDERLLHALGNHQMALLVTVGDEFFAS